MMRILIRSLLCLLLVTSAFAGDWPQWRGPNANGISTETGWNPLALNNPKIVWKTDLGIGYASVSVKDGLLYTMGNKPVKGKQNDFIYCFDANTGRKIWEYNYPCDQGGWPGPRATPTVDKDRVYTLSRYGHLNCFNARTGNVIWQKNLESEGMAVDPDCGISGSPVIDGNRLILNTGGKGLALDKATGRVLWQSGADKGGFATPVLYNKNGRTRLSLLSRTALFDIDPEDGEVAWSMPWVTRYEENSTDPVIRDDKLFISTGYGKGCALLDISGSRPEIIWQNKNMSNHFHTCVLLGDYLYGMDGVMGKKTALRCLNFNTGALVWEKSFDFGPVTAADGKLLILGERGKLYIAEASPEGYKAISSAQLLPMPDDTGVSRNKRNRCWAPPVLANGLIYVRNSYGELVCVDLKT